MFARFWWEFIVGDDWRIAAGLAVALGLSALLVHEDLADLVAPPARGARTPRRVAPPSHAQLRLTRHGGDRSPFCDDAFGCTRLRRVRVRSGRNPVVARRLVYSRCPCARAALRRSPPPAPCSRGRAGNRATGGDREPGSGEKRTCGAQLRRAGMAILRCSSSTEGCSSAAGSQRRRAAKAAIPPAVLRTDRRQRRARRCRSERGSRPRRPPNRAIARVRERDLKDVVLRENCLTREERDRGPEGSINANGDRAVDGDLCPKDG